jgi:hypothetical protein
VPASPAMAAAAQRTRPKNMARKTNLPKVFMSAVAPWWSEPENGGRCPPYILHRLKACATKILGPD